MAAQELDATGLICPLPVLKARKAMKALPAGAELIVRASDPAAYLDFSHWCAESGVEMLEWDREDDIFTFRLRKPV